MLVSEQSSLKTSLHISTWDILTLIACSVVDLDKFACMLLITLRGSFVIKCASIIIGSIGSRERREDDRFHHVNTSCSNYTRKICHLCRIRSLISVMLDDGDLKLEASLYIRSRQFTLVLRTTIFQYPY